MNFIAKNLKQAGVFNTVLIVVTIALQTYLTCTAINMSLFNYFNDLIVIAALVHGLFYAFYGYKKKAANYYKAFMYLALIAFISSAISHFPYSANAKFNTCIALLRIIPIALLAFKKDFGRKNSLTCALLVFVCSLLILGGVSIQFSHLFKLIVLNLNQILLSAITIIFVEAKYADKEARGTK